MAAPPQGGGGQQDNSMAMLWSVAAVFAILGFIWYKFRSVIVVFYLSMKLYEVDLLNLLTKDHYANLHDAIIYAIGNASTVSIVDLLSLGKGVGDVVRYPFVAILVVLAIVVYFANSTRVFRRTYSMQSLVKEERRNWPQIATVSDLNLLKMDIDQGPWAMALQPMQYCKKNRLLDEVRPQRREGMTRKEWDKVEVVLRRGDANRLFALQLGPLWAGTKYLPPYARALFAVFAARINADTKEAARLMAQFAASASAKSGKVDMRGVDDLLKKHENTKLVKKIVQRHAYAFTVMASMLEGAREDGVQASADFLWLKPVDRRLWYILNTVGRQTPFVEVAGIFAHWISEKEANRRIMVPMVDEATKALEIALKEVLYKPDVPN
jgi:intracellular multiplication protein IcmP